MGKYTRALHHNKDTTTPFTPTAIKRHPCGQSSFENTNTATKIRVVSPRQHQHSHTLPRPTPISCGVGCCAAPAIIGNCGCVLVLSHQSIGTIAVSIRETRIFCDLLQTPRVSGSKLQQ